MSLQILLETARKLLQSPLILRVEFLGTKVRAHLPNEYFLDIYYNATLNKYSYTVVKHGQRIIGWDNAPHHKHVKTHPHHFHINIDIDPTYRKGIMESSMKGNPVNDIEVILKKTKQILEL